jgi:excisionase family DNA binding protein
MDKELLEAIRQVFKEEVKVISEPLLTPEELALAMKVPRSWVYEQSRQGRIPTIRVGRYVRFKLNDVLKSQRKENI